MRKRQDEILVMMVEHREGEIVLMIFSMDGLVLEVPKSVVHPPHVPLEGEAQPAQIGWPRHLRPGGGFLGDGQHAGKFRVGDVVEFAEEFDGFQIFAAAILVRNPLAWYPQEG